MPDRGLPHSTVPHELFLLTCPVAEVAIAAGVTKAKVVERPAASFGAWRQMLDRCCLAAIGRAFEPHRDAAEPAIVSVPRPHGGFPFLLVRAPKAPPEFSTVPGHESLSRDRGCRKVKPSLESEWALTSMDERLIESSHHTINKVGIGVRERLHLARGRT